MNHKNLLKNINLNKKLMIAGNIQYNDELKKYKNLANFISKSRLMAGAHYPSDCKFGEEVAQHILGKLK